MQYFVRRLSKINTRLFGHSGSLHSTSAPLQDIFDVDASILRCNCRPHLKQTEHSVITFHDGTRSSLPLSALDNFDSLAKWTEVLSFWKKIKPFKTKTSFSNWLLLLKNHWRCHCSHRSLPHSKKWEKVYNKSSWLAMWLNPTSERKLFNSWAWPWHLQSRRQV